MYAKPNTRALLELCCLGYSQTVIIFYRIGSIFLRLMYTRDVDYYL